MNLIRCKKSKPDSLSEVFDLDHPFWGVSLFPSLKSVAPNAGWYPAIDVTEDKDSVVLKADLPGLKKEDISISVDGSVLTIRGERKSESEDKNKNYHRVERSYGVFERSLDLGTHVDESKVKAAYKEGVLEITVPKTEPPKQKWIEIT